MLTLEDQGATQLPPAESMLWFHQHAGVLVEGRRHVRSVFCIIVPSQALRNMRNMMETDAPHGDRMVTGAQAAHFSQLILALFRSLARLPRARLRLSFRSLQLLRASHRPRPFLYVPFPLLDFHSLSLSLVSLIHVSSFRRTRHCTTPSKKQQDG